jgi:hypothetical protein
LRAEPATWTYRPACAGRTRWSLLSCTSSAVNGPRRTGMPANARRARAFLMALIASIRVPIQKGLRSDRWSGSQLSRHWPEPLGSPSKQSMVVFTVASAVGRGCSPSRRIRRGAGCRISTAPGD